MREPEPSQETLFPVENRGRRRRLPTDEPIAFETEVVALPLDEPIWGRVFTVAPLVLVGTKDRFGQYNLAPKHMATPIGWSSYYGFVCRPEHATWKNVERYGHFTVSFPHHFQVVQAGLAASRREPDGSKPNLAALPTFPATTLDGVLVHGCYLFLECELDRIVDGFDGAGLVVGKIVAAAARDEARRDPDRDDADILRGLPPLAYLAPGRFSDVGESLAFPFPAGFRR